MNVVIFMIAATCGVTKGHAITLEDGIANGEE